MNEPKKMEFNDSNARDLKEPDNKSYDTNFKRFFSRKDVLAGILINIVPEFKYLSLEEVKQRIESSEEDPDRAKLLANEDVDSDQKIVYDVVVNVDISIDVQRTICLIFDFEMQREFNMKYPLMNRAIYYVSRLVAKQKIEKAAYETLKPVQSAWVCLYDIPPELQNKYLHFEYTALDKFGFNTGVKLPGQDLTRIDFLLLSESYDWDTTDEQVIKFLQSIFHNNLSSQDFNPYISADDAVNREVDDMLGGIEQLKAEMERRSELAAERAEKEGMAKGMESGAFGIIALLYDMGVTSEQDISKKLVEKLPIDTDQAMAYIKEYKEKI